MNNIHLDLPSGIYQDIYIHILNLSNLFIKDTGTISTNDLLKFNDALEVLESINYDLNKKMIRKTVRKV
jgi:hypothetical protein